MRIIYFIIFLITDVFVLKAQNVHAVWADQWVATGYIEGLSITRDAAGNVYTTGDFSGTVDLDPGPGTFNLSSVGTYDVFISKVDAAGNFIWGMQFTGSGGFNNYASSRSVAVDAAGNVYTTGFFSGSYDFDPGFYSYVLNSEDALDLFITKLNPEGGLLWAKQIGGPGVQDAHAIAVDVTGNVYTTGEFNGTVDFDPGKDVFNLSAVGGSDMFVSKLDAAGNFVWAEHLGGSSSISGVSLALDGAGNIFTAGDYGGAANFDPGVGLFNLNAGNSNVFISKWDAGGNLKWTKQIISADYTAVSSIALDASADIYATGVFRGTVDFDPGPGISNLTASGQGYNGFVTKLTRDGDFIWARQVGGSGGTDNYIISNAVALDPDGNAYITGYFTGTVDFNPGTDDFSQTSHGGWDIYVSKLNANGDFVWAKQVGSTENDHANSIAADPDGNVYTTGSFSGTVDFDPGSTVRELTSGGAWSMFAQKWSQCNNPVYTTFNASACKSYSWNNQNYTQEGMYTDSLVAENGCDSIVTLQLVIRPEPVVPGLGKDSFFCRGESLILYPGDYTDYLWQDGSLESHYTVNKAGIYSVDVSSPCGTGHAEITVKENACGLTFPSAFSPNNDGHNDFFKMINPPQLGDYDLSIYDRWGVKVFETRDEKKGWDGTSKGHLQGTGAYIWLCKFKKANSPESFVKGTVILIR